MLHRMTVPVFFSRQDISLSSLAICISPTSNAHRQSLNSMLNLNQFHPLYDLVAEKLLAQITEVQQLGSYRVVPHDLSTSAMRARVIHEGHSNKSVGLLNH
jgi:hypothetical protein